MFRGKPDARSVALFSVLVTLGVVFQLMPGRPLGLEFTSFLSFSSGMIFGAVFGASLGALVMFVNAFLSPIGLAGLNMPFQMLGMGIIGAAGGLYKTANHNQARFHAEAAVLGAFLTFVYYLITNLSFALTVSLPQSNISFLQAVILANILGAPVTLLYVASNAALFGIGVVPLTNAVQKLLGR